jgi:hypothetical protein
MTESEIPKNPLSAEHEEYLQRLKEVSVKVELVLKKNPQYDPADLFRIAMNKYKTPEELLARGIRRKIISGL